MKILIVEDDDYKAKQLTDFLSDNYQLSNECITVRRAFQSGMDAIAKNIYDIILLDMSIPSFDNGLRQSAGRYRYYGGREILNEMKRKDISTPCLVVTQFSVFGQGENQMDDVQLDKILREEYNKIYKGMIHYSPSMLDWKASITKIINSIVRD